ncbi:MAG: DUF899 family protein [Armatimonadetes bacterium]|nr:DUF899 family protein [Armatimonadota bacterium]
MPFVHRAHRHVGRHDAHFEGLGGNLAVAAKAPIERVAAFARDKHIRLLSAANNSFKRDYHGDDAAGSAGTDHDRVQAMAGRGDPPALGV